jgi:hypothetical protein
MLFSAAGRANYALIQGLGERHTQYAMSCVRFAR